MRTLKQIVSILAVAVLLIGKADGTTDAVSGASVREPLDSKAVIIN